MSTPAKPTPQPSERDEKWQRDKVKVHRLPPGSTQMTMRGGTMLAGIRPGDDVELYVDTGAQDAGEWRSGYVCTEGPHKGEMGGPYDNEQVVSVLRADALHTARMGIPRGVEWPANLARSASGNDSTDSTESTSQDQQAQGAEENAPQGAGQGKKPPDDMFRSTATFNHMGEVEVLFRFDPAQERGYHGRWIDEGKQPLPSIKQPVPKYTPEQGAKGADYMAQQGITGQSVADRALSFIGEMPPAQADDYRMWYNRANREVIEPWAKSRDIQSWRVAGVAAATSPLSVWGGDNLNYQDNSNQAITRRILDIALDPAWTQRTINITPAFAKAILAEQDREYRRGMAKTNAARAKRGKAPKPVKTVEQKAKALLNWESYNGHDRNFKKGTSLVGTHKLGDLPADAVAVLLRHQIRYMTGNSAKAIMIARGEDPADVLGGAGKTRSFYNNLLDPDNSEDVTIDTHMVRALIDNANLDDDTLKNYVHLPERYAVFDQGVRLAAQKLGWKPHQVQAAIWKHWKDLHPSASRRKATKAGLTGWDLYEEDHGDDEQETAEE